MRVPIFGSPVNVLLLHDNPDGLAMLPGLAPAAWPWQLLSSQVACQLRIQQDSADRQADTQAQQAVLDQWRCGLPLIPQILQYWSALAPSRPGRTQVCVVDCAIDAVHGLPLLEALRDWPGATLLLAEQAEAPRKLLGVNPGVMAQRMPKDAPDRAARVLDTVAELLAVTCEAQAALWAATLTPVHHGWLHVPAVARSLVQWLAGRWVDYVVIGAPFGVLGRDAWGAAGWLQLEPRNGLDELAELAESVGAPLHALEPIRQGRQLMAVELSQALGRTSPPPIAEAFVLGDDGLLGALFAV